MHQATTRPRVCALVAANPEEEKNIIIIGAEFFAPRPRKGAPHCTRAAVAGIGRQSEVANPSAGVISISRTLPRFAPINARSTATGTSWLPSRTVYVSPPSRAPGSRVGMPYMKFPEPV
eukprot:scaffold971_cov107-Isochrysis_galbana.AAC.10